MKERAVQWSITSNRLAGTRQHKQSAVLLRKLEFISIWKGRPKETTVQAKLSVRVYKSDCVSVTDTRRWI